MNIDRFIKCKYNRYSNGDGLIFNSVHKEDLMLSALPTTGFSIAMKKQLYNKEKNTQNFRRYVFNNEVLQAETIFTADSE